MAPPTQGIPTVIRIPVELLARLDQHADENRITRAEMVRRILAEALEET